MQIFIVEREENTGEGFWQSGGITLCSTFEIARREMLAMIKKSNEGEFSLVEMKDEAIATSKNGWVKFRIYPCDVINQ